jgi:hypothetical protein
MYEKQRKKYLSRCSCLGESCNIFSLSGAAGGALYVPPADWEERDEENDSQVVTRE